MNKKVRHVLGISGGKDSAALAMYMKMNHPEIDMEYYFSDTGKELPETYELIAELESFLGKKIIKLEANHSHKNPFDHYLDIYNGFLPSSMARWCTQKLKLEPFERWIGNDLAISYVGIRDDEDREGYVSTKSNIQSVFHSGNISGGWKYYTKYCTTPTGKKLPDFTKNTVAKKCSNVFWKLFGNSNHRNICFHKK